MSATPYDAGRLAGMDHDAATAYAGTVAAHRARYPRLDALDAYERWTLARSLDHARRTGAGPVLAQLIAGGYNRLAVALVDALHRPCCAPEPDQTHQTLCPEARTVLAAYLDAPTAGAADAAQRAAVAHYGPTTSPEAWTRYARARDALVDERRQAGR